MILRDYQEKAIIMIRNTLRSGNKKPVIVLPTGAGKSVIYAKIIKSVIDNGKKILWLVHRRNLVYQMQDLLELHFKIYPGIIMSGIASSTDKPAQLATIQTYAKRLKLRDIEFNRFFIDADVILIDECHRAVSKTYKDIIELYDKKIIIGCTATPCRGDGRGLGEIFDSLVDVIDIKELTEKKYLAPARYFVPTNIDLNGIKLSMGDYVIKQLDNRVNTPKIIGDIVENWLKLAENRKTIVFCVNVKHSIAVKEAFEAAGINAAHLDAKSSDEEREYIFSAMDRGDITVVTNVALYTEGLDVPDVSCIVMARPTRSFGLMRQCLGRGLRISEGKKDTLILDHGGIVEEHGFLEDPVAWSLDGHELAWKKQSKKEKPTKPVKCKICFEVFTGCNVCPRCGTKLKTFGKKVDTIDADLFELKNKKTLNRQHDKIKKRQVYGALLWHCHKKLYSEGWAAHKYRSFYGVWPNAHRGCPSIKPESAEIKNILKHILIKSAKAYKKRRAA